MTNKPGKPKEKTPEWMKMVDRDMFLYVKWEQVIKQQQNIIDTHDLLGMRTTPVYELREGSSGGETVYQADRIIMDIEFATIKINAGTKYRADLEETVRLVAAGNPEREEFCRLYWWTGTDRHVGPRSMLVCSAIPFLAHHDWGTKRVTKPNSTFYAWRDDIYRELADLLGYGDMASELKPCQTAFN